ncbi:MAG TPA: hypothetical protein PL082_06780 [Tepidiformaceae bacterium]|nr:hypothetical protein [Tepidiformaceae bacterium]
MKWFGVFHRPQRPGTFMMRLRIPGGTLTSAQLLAVAEVARAYGHETVDLTTRQGLQLRDLRLPDIPAVVVRLESVGLSARQTGLDNVRNFIGCPLAGIDGMELFDSTPLVLALNEAHRAAGKSLSNLPRKLNVSVAGCRDDCGHAQTQDIGFVPATADSGVGGWLASTCWWVAPWAGHRRGSPRRSMCSCGPRRWCAFSWRWWRSSAITARGRFARGRG